MKKLLITIILLSAGIVHAQSDEKETLRQLNQSVISLYQSQKFDEALKIAQQSLNLTVKLFGAKDSQTASAYSNLGIIYREKKKYKESIENLQNALEIYRTKTGATGKELVNAYETLASAYLSSGKEKEAEANYLKSLETSEMTFGKDSKESLLSISDLAIFYAKTKNEEKSNDYYLKSYALTIKYFGKDSNEFETLNIYEKYYSQSKLWTNDDQYKKYKEKKAALFGYELGDVTSLIRPAYTARGKQGRIVIKVWINEQGNVTDAKAVYGVMAFATDCEEAARKAKFKPSYMNGKPISVVNYIAYNFVS